MHNPRTALSAPPCALLPTPEAEQGTHSLVIPAGAVDLGFAVIVGVAEVWNYTVSDN